MTHPTTARPSRTRRLRTPFAASVLTASVLAAALATIPSAAQAAPGTPVPLGAGSTFAVLGAAGVTNSGTSVLGSDVGSFPNTSIDGGIVLQGAAVNHGGDSVSQQAQIDLDAAFLNASGQTPELLGGVELGGLTLVPGVYTTGGVIELNGNLTLDGNGDPEAVFIFQSTATLLAAAASSITFIDGATACNVYWRIPSSAAILAGSQFAGTIMAESLIAFEAGASLNGRALSMNGQVTLISNTITSPGCAPVVAPTTPAPSVTPTPTVAPTTAGPVAAATAGPQVRVTPRGGIDTGDGSSIAGTPWQAPALVALTLVGLAALVLMKIAPRRTRG